MQTLKVHEADILENVRWLECRWRLEHLAQDILLPNLDIITVRQELANTPGHSELFSFYSLSSVVFFRHKIEVVVVWNVHN